MTDSGTHSARHVVVASGARLKRLGVPGEAEFEGRGVSQCADCDGPMYQNEEAIVVGGGDSAFQEALVLAQLLPPRASSCIAATRSAAAPHFVEQVKANDKISIVRNATVEAILGGKMVEKARVKHADGRVEELPCAGVFAYIGLEPNTEFLPADGRARRRRVRAHRRRVPDDAARRVGDRRGAQRLRGTLDDAIDEAQRVAAAVRARLT